MIELATPPSTQGPREPFLHAISNGARAYPRARRARLVRQRSAHRWSGRRHAAQSARQSALAGLQLGIGLPQQTLLELAEPSRRGNA